MNLDIHHSKDSYLDKHLPKTIRERKALFSLLFSLLIVSGIFYSAYSVRMNSADEEYLLAADPHYWYRMTKYIVEDNEPEYDPLRMYLDSPEIKFQLFPYVAAKTYNLASALGETDFYRFLFWFPAFIAALCVFPAFWIGRELHSNVAGIFCAFFIVFTPSFLSRSVAGFFDTDCMIILLSCTVVAFFLSAYNRVDPKNWKKPAPIIVGGLAGAALALLSLTWSTGFAYMPWLFMGLFGLHWLYVILLAKGSNAKEKIKNSWIFFRSHLMVYLAMIFVFFAITVPIQGTEPIEKIVAVTTFFQTAKAEGGIFPNVWISISEEMGASLVDVAGRLGTYIFFLSFLGLFALTSSFLETLKSKQKEGIYGLLITGFIVTIAIHALGLLGEYSGLIWVLYISFILSAIVVLTSTNQQSNILLGLGALLLTLVLSSVLPSHIDSSNATNLNYFLIGGFALAGSFLGTALKREDRTLTAFFLMALWVGATLYGSLWAVRFVQMLAIPMAICAGIGMGIVIHRLDSKILKDHKSTTGLIILAAVALITSFIVHTMLISDTSLYANAEAVSNSYGTGISSGWESSMLWLKNNTPECTVVATYWDPGYWIAALSERRTIYDGGSQNYHRNTKLNELNGLDCITDRQGYITEINGTEYCVTSRMQDMAGVIYTSDEVWAGKVLETYLGDCEEIYFLASSDLIGKSQWWTYFSNWDPEAGSGTAYPYTTATFTEQKSLLLENGSALVYGPFVLKVTYNDEGEQIIEPLLYQQGTYYKIQKMVIYSNDTATKLEYPNAQVSGTLWIDPSFQMVLYMPPEIENSIFTKTYFFNGEGLEYFEPAYLTSEVKLFKFDVEKFREDMKEGSI